MKYQIILMTGQSFFKPQSGALLSPALDFLMVGGGALLCLMLFAFIPHTESVALQIWVISLMISNFVNHPHFANSYQIFYDNFRQKLLADHYPLPLRLRYWWAGIFFPIFALIFYSVCLFGEFYSAMGWAGNVMFFLVGWHYAKQGYGILIVLSVKEKIFLSAKEKQALLLNSYVVWITSYLMANQVLGEVNYLGIKYFVFATPQWLLTAAALVMVFSTSYCVGLLLKRYRETGEMPSINGLIAYISSSYIWLFIRWVDSIFFLLIPAFHSLQYLPFVWCYKYNQYRQDKAHRYGSIFRVLIFIASGILLGVAGFYLMPRLLLEGVTYNEPLFGASVFIFICWTFINIHHYFIDNAIWRKENKDVQKYLFQS